MIQTRRYYDAINVRISLDGYGSKIRTESRHRPAVSNETILATKQEFFFTKIAPVQSITDFALLVCLINTAPLDVIFHPTLPIYSFVIFFSNGYISVNTIFECSYLFFNSEIGHALSTYATGAMEEGPHRP